MEESQVLTLQIWATYMLEAKNPFVIALKVAWRRDCVL